MNKWIYPFAVSLAVSANAAVINVTSDRTFTDADQAQITASDGISISSGVTLTFNIASALTLEAGQPIMGAGNILVTGSGKLYIKGANPDFSGKITVNTAQLHVYNRNSTGPDNGSGTSGTELVGTASIHLHNCDLYEALKFPSLPSAYIWADEGDCTLRKGPSGKYQPAAAVGATFHTGASWTPWCAQTVQGGGIVDFNSTYGYIDGGIVNNDSTTVLISKALTYGDDVIYYAWTGNVYPVLKFGANDVGNKVRVRSTNSSAGWCNNMIDLNGFNQTAMLEFTCPYLGKDADRYRGSVVKSASAAYLRALGSSDTKNAAAFTEHAGFRWAGTSDLELIQVSTSDNELWVESNTLTISANASWANASAVRATGTGTLCLSHAGAVGEATDVYITDSGMISIPEGVTVRVRDLYIDGVKQMHGTWGSASPAYYQDGHFTGGGVLAVSADIKLTENTTWTEAQQDLVNAASSLEIASGVTLTLNVSSGESLSIGLSVTGAGAIAKTGAGTATLGAVNAYAGTTTVSGGNLIVEDAAGLGSANADVILSGDGKLVLSYAGTASIKGLYFGSEKQIPGTWGGADSVATNKDAVRFGGTGLLGVSANVVIDANTTWTEAQQMLVDAADSIEIQNGVTLTIDLAEGKELSIGTVIMGAGALVKNGAGDLKLSGANTYTGITTVNAGKLHVYSNAGLGAAGVDGRTAVNGGGVYLHNVTTGERFYSSLNETGVWGAEGTSTVTGEPNYTGNGGFFGALKDCRLNVNGTYMPFGYLTPGGEGTVAYGSSFLYPYGGWFHTSSTVVYLNRELYLDAPVSYYLYSGGSVVPKLHLGANNVLNRVKLTMGNAPTWNNAEVYLDGHSQSSVPCFTAKPGNSFEKHPRMFSSSTATLRALASDLPSNSCVFAEHAGFTWAGTTDLELCAPSSTDGELCAESGTLTMGAMGSWTNATKVTVGGGAAAAKLVLTHKKSLGRNSVVDIRTNGKLELPADVIEHVGELRFNGVKVPDGVYGSTSSRAMEKDSDRFSGEGMLKVGVVGMYLIVR